MSLADAETQGLSRYLTPLDGWALGFGCAVGWGAFVMPGTTFLPVAGPAGTVIALVLGMVFMLILAQPELMSFGTEGLNPAYAVFSLVILAPWAFVGFEVISFDTSHFRFAVKKSKGMMVAIILAAGFVYIAMSLVSVASAPDGYASWAEYLGDIDNLAGVASVPTFCAAQSIMGPFGLIVVAISAFAAIFTGIIGGYRATMRVLSSMAEDRILSDAFSRTWFSILFIMVLSVGISLLGRNTLTWFVDLTSFGAIVAYGYTSASALKLARAEGNRLVTVTGFLGAVIAIVFALVQLVPRISALFEYGGKVTVR